MASFALGNCRQHLFLADYICQYLVKYFKSWQDCGISCPTPKIQRKERAQCQGHCEPQHHHHWQITGDLVWAPVQLWCLTWQFLMFLVWFKVFTIMSTACKPFKMSSITDKNKIKYGEHRICDSQGSCDKNASSITYTFAASKEVPCNERLTLHQAFSDQAFFSGLVLEHVKRKCSPLTHLENVLHLTRIATYSPVLSWALQ